MMPLTFASVGQTAVIQRITGKDDVRQHLAELGFVAGEKVTIISSNGGISRTELGVLAYSG